MIVNSYISMKFYFEMKSFEDLNFAKLKRRKCRKFENLDGIGGGIDS